MLNDPIRMLMNTIQNVGDSVGKVVQFLQQIARIKGSGEGFCRARDLRDTLPKWDAWTLLGS